jgi:hypothetical protein
MRLVRRGAIVLAVLSAPMIGAGGRVAAQIWEQLKGDDLHAAFDSRVLEYEDGATQRFDPNGRTEYRRPPALDFSGFWWVDSNLLCFVLEPENAGRCFKVHQDDQGVQLKLEPEGGGTLKLRYRHKE